MALVRVKNCTIDNCFRPRKKGRMVCCAHASRQNRGQPLDIPIKKIRPPNMNRKQTLKWITTNKCIIKKSPKNKHNLKTPCTLWQGYTNTHKTILSKKQVYLIKELYSSKLFSQRDLAKYFKVSRGCIDPITRGINWKYLEEMV